MGNISKFIQLFCLLFERVKQKPRSAHRKKKSHKQKDKLLGLKKKKSINLKGLQPRLFSSFPVFRVHRASQRIGKEERGRPMETANSSLHPCKATAVTSQP